MSETHNVVHLVVERGPDQGLDITVPAGGARAGRSSGNDIVLADPSLSRFHCRFHFKDGRDLCVSDLASTNETVVNGKPVSDMQLFVGDRVTIGETTMKVVCDTLYAPSAAAAPRAAAPPPVPAAPLFPAAASSPSASAPAAAPAAPLFPSAAVAPAAPAAAVPAAGREIDLGLRKDEMESGGGARRPMSRVKMAFLLVLCLLVIAVAALLKHSMNPKAVQRARTSAGADSILEVRYEKVQADVQNVFRYYLTLDKNLLTVKVDNLADGRHVIKEKKADPQLLGLLASELDQSGFFALDEEYTGVVPEVWNLSDLTLTINRRTHRTRVLNRLEPDTFKSVRDKIEEFAKNEIGLYALSLPPEKLVELGRNAWLMGQKMFDEREVRNDNLFRAIKAFSEVEGTLETVEPKPEFYAAAIAAREESKRMLEQRYQDFMFRAERAIKLNDWKEANGNLQILLEMIQDRGDPRYDAVYKKLVDVQRRLERR